MMAKLESFISFGYAITKPFSDRWRYSNVALILFAIISLAGFTALNVVLVGYDVISYSSSNFNSSQRLPFVLAWRSQDHSCQEHTFQLGDGFRTNTSAFSYTIFNVASSRPDAEVQGGFMYANNTLEKCDATQFEAVVSPGERLITVNAIVDCPPPLGFQASTSWSYSNHLILGLVSPAVFPENSLARAILDAMTQFAGEAYYPIWNRLYTLKPDHSQLYRVSLTAQPTASCASPSSRPCIENRTNIALTYYNGITLKDLQIAAGAPDSVDADLNTLTNLLEIFYAGLQLDLGRWTSGNLFTNTTSFKNAIRPYIPGDPGFNGSKIREPASSKGLAYVNSTSPPSADVATPPAVIQIPYICNTRRRKSPGSFVVSVLSATLSMFLSAWGLVIAVLSSLARRYEGANSCCESTRETFKDDPASVRLRDTDVDSENKEESEDYTFHRRRPLTTLV